MKSLFTLSILAMLGLMLGACNPGEREQFKQSIKSISDWTPENIAKYPQEYLTYSIGQCDAVMERLKVNEIRIKQSRGQIEQRHEDSAAKVKSGEQAVAELKETYKAAEAGNTFPVEWRGQKRDQEWMKLNIVAIFKQTESEKKNAATLDSALKRLDAELTKNGQTKAQATTQKSQAQSALATLEVQNLSKELEDQLVAMQASISGMLTLEAEDTSVISLDSLVAQEEPKANDEEFAKIMGQ